MMGESVIYVARASAPPLAVTQLSMPRPRPRLQRWMKRPWSPGVPTRDLRQAELAPVARLAAPLVVRLVALCALTTLVAPELVTPQAAAAQAPAPASAPISPARYLAPAPTVALWLFDEQQGLYPSHVLNDASASDYPMVIGLGARIVPGRFGNALEVLEEPLIADALKMAFPQDWDEAGAIRFGLKPPAKPAGREVEPMYWGNANFAALMTSGENHLRKEVGFAEATATPLNIGGSDWTVELWYRPTRRSTREGVVFELGEGPRGENDRVTRLTLAADRGSFSLRNQPAGVTLTIPTDADALDPAEGEWRHLAFVYDAAASQLRHYLDGRLQPLPERTTLKPLAAGTEPYFSVGRDATWGRPLPGAIDELRFSTGQRYTAEFPTPGSFARPHRAPELVHGPPLLFAEETAGPVPLGSRKHLFIDDAFVDSMERVTFTPNPPRKAELVLPDIQGPFRKHVTVIEDEDGLIRLYNGVEDDRLEVHAATDGVHFEDFETGIEYRGSRNIAVPEATATGTVFIDPNAPPEERWKFMSGYHDRGTYMYSSPDGWIFARHPTAVIPLRVGSQINVFWDDQRGTYVSYHRSDCHAYPGGGETRREWVMVESADPTAPWEFTPRTREAAAQIRKEILLRDPQPWYMDNGPLTPGGYCKEYPSVFGPDEAIDPVGTDPYVPKAMKYPYAPDVYLAFPTMYFHYWDIGPEARRTLGREERGLGSGPIETQIEVSRDAVHWKRYPRPAYVGVGKHEGYDIIQAYIAQGMVRRGDEIWQYYFGTEEYHSNMLQDDPRRGVFRLVQRLDGFVSAETPYDTTGVLVTKPFTFEGNRLVLNIDTDATGYAQVGILDENSRPIPGFDVDSCVYINGDFIQKEVEWLEKGTDLSGLEGRTVQLVFRMRGSKLYAMQFVRR